MLLTGHSGSGKTSVATRLVSDDCLLFQIDEYYRATPRTDSNIDWSRDAKYRTRVYRTMEKDIVRALKEGVSVIVETTGGSACTMALYDRLKKIQGLTTVVIHLRLTRQEARARIRLRNQSEYPVKCPAAFVNVTAEAFKESSLPIDFVVDAGASRQSVLREVTSIVRLLRS
jgi:predicted kinase